MQSDSEQWRGPNFGDGGEMSRGRALSPSWSPPRNENQLFLSLFIFETPLMPCMDNHETGLEIWGLTHQSHLLE